MFIQGKDRRIYVSQKSSPLLGVQIIALIVLFLPLRHQDTKKHKKQPCILSEPLCFSVFVAMACAICPQTTHIFFGFDPFIVVPFKKSPSTNTHSMKKGKLKFYNRFKGYGLITDFETGQEFQVSPAGMQDMLIKDGDNVVFEAVEGRNGMNAVEIRLDNFILNT